MKTKGLFSLGFKDIAKGLIVTVITSILTSTVTILNSGNIPTDFASWKPTLMAGVSAGIAYVLKNYFTNSQDQFAKSEPKPADAK